MSYTTTSDFKSKSFSELLEDIYCRIDKLENNMLGIKKDNKPADINIIANLDIDNTNANKHIDEVKENIEELNEMIEEIELPDIRPIISFYGCSFNFGEGSAEATYHMGDDNWERKVEN